MITPMKQTMKRMTKIRLINWHYFEDETISVTGSCLFSGENGSGKSTILDAIQFVLTTNTKKFNPAANEKSKRDLKGYIHCKTGEEGNVYVRPKSVISYIAIEFYEESKDKYFVVGVKIDSTDIESDAKKKWFIEDGIIEDFSFVTNNRPSTDEQFRKNGKKVSMIQQVSEAKSRIKVRLGHLDDNFFDIIIKSLAFKPMDNVKKFINQFILPEKNIDVVSLRENISNLREMQKIVDDLKKQIIELKGILELYESIEEINYDILVIEVLLKLAALQNKKDNIKCMANQIENKKQMLSSNEEKLKNLQYEIVSENKKLTDIQVSIQTSECASLINRIKNEIEIIEIKKEQNEKEEKKLKQQIKNAIAAIDITKNRSDDITLFSIKELLEPKNTEYERNELAIRLKEVIDKSKKNNEDERLKLVNVCYDLEQNVKNLQNEVNTLKKNKIIYPKNTCELQEAIKKEFAYRGIKSEVRVLADMLEVTDEKWQNAIEGYLNSQKFYIVVDPSEYDIAAEVYNKNKSRIHSVALINTQALDVSYIAPETSLANIVTSQNRYAKAYVNYILGRVIRCDTVEELKNHDIAITDGCMLYQGKALRKINPSAYEVPYIGQNAIKKQLEIKNNHLKEVQYLLDEKSRELKIVSHNFELYNQFNSEILLECLNVPLILLKQNDKLKDLSKQLKEAENNPGFIDLQMKASKLESELEAKRDVEGKLTKGNGRLEAEISGLEDGLSYISREIDSINADITRIISGNLSIRDDAQKKYDEHITQKSAQKIHDNFTTRKTYLENQRMNKINSLVQKQTLFKSGELGTGSDQEIINEYKKEYSKLEKHEILSCEERLITAKENCELEFRENFLGKLRENIEHAQDIFKNLNNALKLVKYGRDEYRFKYSANEHKQELYRMIMSEINLGGNTLFSNEFEKEYHSEMEDLFTKLTESDDQGEVILKEYTDYRGYLDYDIEVISNGKTQMFSKIHGEKSGGETQTPYYVAIAASFYQQYSSKESIRLIMLDEAFDKMDDDRIRSMMEFFKQWNFQVVLATPPAKMEVIDEFVEDTFLIIREDHTSIVEDYHYVG